MGAYQLPSHEIAGARLWQALKFRQCELNHIISDAVSLCFFERRRVCGRQNLVHYTRRHEFFTDLPVTASTRFELMASLKATQPLGFRGPHPAPLFGQTVLP